jgi:hypothetical protein
MRTKQKGKSDNKYEALENGLNPWHRWSDAWNIQKFFCKERKDERETTFLGCIIRKFTHCF